MLLPGVLVSTQPPSGIYFFNGMATDGILQLLVVLGSNGFPLGFGWDVFDGVLGDATSPDS